MSYETTPTYITPYRGILGNLPGTLTGAMFIIQADAVISEEHEDELIMTDNPVEVGTVTTDHAFDLPCTLVLTYAWSGGSPQNNSQDASFLKSLYQQFLSVKANKTLLQVFTGKRQYNSMLIRVISVTTEKESENILRIRVQLRELIIATTQNVTVGVNVGDINNQAMPWNTAPVLPQGPVALSPGGGFNPNGLSSGGS